jgi:hypothetical protein
MVNKKTARCLTESSFLNSAIDNSIEKCYTLTILAKGRKKQKKFFKKEQKKLLTL